jgi:GT2 family glycosyltransferase
VGPAPLVSLVLATTGRSTELLPLLRSLQQQTEARFELVVVDQNGDDRLLPLLQPLRDAGMAVQHLRQAQRHAGRARNAGADAACAALLAFPDDDAWYEPQTLAAALAALQAHPQADGLVGHWVELAAPAPRLDLPSWRRFRGGDASMVTLFVRRQAFVDGGGFDERLGPGAWFGGGEETDLLLRSLSRQGCWVHDPAVRVHHASQAACPLSVAQCLARARGTGALYARHRLPAWVVLRGLLAPVLLPWRHGLTPAQALATAAGRAQGLLAWWWRHGRGA